MATARAQSFALRARTTATRLEIAFRDAERLQQEWFALNMSADIPNDTTEILDTDSPQGMTGAQVTSIITRAGELVTDYTANSNAKLNTILQGSDAPSDWR